MAITPNWLSDVLFQTDSFNPRGVDNVQVIAGKNPRSQKSLGIPLSTFYSASMRPCTFVGWNTEKWIAINNNQVFMDHVNFVQYFQYNWADGNGVKDAFDIASKRSDVKMIHYSTLKIFGYPDLPFDSFNR